LAAGAWDLDTIVEEVAMSDLLMRPLVLIAGADTNSCDLCGNWFAREGFEVVGTAAGDWAIAIAAEYRPEVVVMDLALARIDGLTVIRYLRAGRDTVQIPILLMTPTRDESVIAAVRGWRVDMLPAPITFDTLALHVRGLALERTSAPTRPPLSMARLIRQADAVYAGEIEARSGRFDH
jgi:two-component system, OmpR family, response regulator